MSGPSGRHRPQVPSYAAHHKQSSEYFTGCRQKSSIPLMQGYGSTRYEPAKESGSANLDRFLQAVTPKVTARFMPKTSIKKSWSSETVSQSFYVLDDLWSAYEEWSAYGAGVPIEIDYEPPFTQYYVPTLSAIQIYTVAGCRAKVPFRKPGDESDYDISTDSSSDSDGERLSRNVRIEFGDFGAEPMKEILKFQYMEELRPWYREPFVDKVRSFEALRSLESSEVGPSSWMAVAWYPIYRIPTGPKLGSLEASFLTFHHLSPDPLLRGGVQGWDGQHAEGTLPVFGLSTYKFRGPVWRVSKKYYDLKNGAELWLQRMGVHLPDFQFFASREPY